MLMYHLHAEDDHSEEKMESNAENSCTDMDVNVIPNQSPGESDEKLLFNNEDNIISDIDFTSDSPPHTAATLTCEDQPIFTSDLTLSSVPPIQRDIEPTDSVDVQLSGKVDSTGDATDAKGSRKTNSQKLEDMKFKEFRTIGHQFCISRDITFPTRKRFIQMLNFLYKKDQLNEESLKIALEKEAQAAARGEVPFVRVGENEEKERAFLESFQGEQVNKYRDFAKQFCEEQKILIPKHSKLRTILKGLFDTNRLNEKNLTSILIQYAKKNSNQVLNPDAVKHRSIANAMTSSGAENTKSMQSNLGGTKTVQGSKTPQAREGDVSDKQRSQKNAMVLPCAKPDIKAKNMSSQKFQNIQDEGGLNLANKEVTVPWLLANIAEKKQLLDELDRQNRTHTESGVSRKTIRLHLRYAQYMLKHKQTQVNEELVTSNPEPSQQFGPSGSVVPSSSSREHFRNEKDGFGEQLWNHDDGGSNPMSFQMFQNFQDEGGLGTFNKEVTVPWLLANIAEKKQLLDELDRQNRTHTESGVSRKTIRLHLRHAQYLLKRKQKQPMLNEPFGQCGPPVSTVPSSSSGDGGDGLRNQLWIHENRGSSSMEGTSKQRWPKSDGFIPPRKIGNDRFIPPRGNGNDRFIPPRGNGNDRFIPPRGNGNDRFIPPRGNENYGFVPPRGNDNNSSIPPRGSENSYDDLRHKVNELKRVNEQMEKTIFRTTQTTTFVEVSREGYGLPPQGSHGSDRRWPKTDYQPPALPPPPPPMISNRLDESERMQQNENVNDWYAGREPPQKKYRFDEDRQLQSRQFESQRGVTNDLPPPPPPPPSISTLWDETTSTPPSKQSKDFHSNDWMNQYSSRRACEDSSMKGREDRADPSRAMSMVKTNPPLMKPGKNYKVAIVHENYPAARITTKESIAIRDELLLRIGVERGVGPRFSNTFEENGAIVFECENQQTVDWLWANVFTITPWRGAKLVPMAWEKPPIEITLEAPKFMDRMSPEDICLRLMSQNPEISTEAWKFKSSQLTSKGLDLIFHIDDKSVETLKSLNFKPNLGFSRVDVYINRQ